MPGRNRTGPMGLGPMTGRGLGLCNPSRMMRGAVGLGAGYLVARRGLGRGIARRGALTGWGLCRGAMMGLGLAGGLGLGLKYVTQGSTGREKKTQQEVLQERKEKLEISLETINKQLEELHDQE